MLSNYELTPRQLARIKQLGCHCNTLAPGETCDLCSYIDTIKKMHTAKTGNKLRLITKK